ncbi:MAG: hypothetical protein WCO07_01070 [bacterium]
MKKEFIKSIKIIILSIIFSFGVGYLFSFNNPTNTPPDGNIPIPINSSTTPQAKGGDVLSSPPLLDIRGTLSADSLSVWSNPLINGKVKITGLGSAGDVCVGPSGYISLCNTRLLTVRTTGTGKVVSDPAGISCGGGTNACTLKASGEVVLGTVPSGVFVLNSWSGCDSTLGNIPSQVCIVNMTTSAKAVTANFDIPVSPVLTTIAASSITKTDIVSGGNITSNGGAAISARGVVWSATNNPPTLANSYTSDGAGASSFVSVISGLTPNSPYYVRAYATNSYSKTGYGNVLTVTTATSTPILTTTAVSNIAQTTATTGGTITNTGGSAVLERGIAWGSLINPTISNNHTSDGSGSGSFVTNLIGLKSDKTYHIRAYATNSLGTEYGQDITFTTLQIPCAGSRIANSLGDVYCWYKHTTKGQACSGFCSTNGHGSCVNVSGLTHADQGSICTQVELGGFGGGSFSPTPRGVGGVCYVQGYPNTTNVYSSGTCSSANSNHFNACACSQ